MKRFSKFSMTLSVAMMTAAAFASDAETSATAAGSRDARNGTASATARYAGDVGFARTDTRSGEISRARGVAVGVDRDGLTFSLSNAFATRDGLGLATNFNISIDRDGRVSRSGGIALADSPIERSVAAGGSATNGRFGAPATSYATAHADRYGRVEARTYADVSRGAAVGREMARTVTVRRVEPVRMIRTAPPEMVRYPRVSR